LPSIYVDLDDVIANTTCHYVDILKCEFGRTVDFDRITSFNLQESLHLSDSEYEYFFHLVHEPEIILGLEPVTDAVKVLNSWSEQGYEISVITGRLTSTYESSLDWLKSNRIPFDSFLIVDKYSRPGVDKNIAVTLERFAEMEFILAVEDSIDMTKFIRQRMSIPVILYDRPWNRNSKMQPGIRRCKTWKEIANIPFNSV